MSYSIIFKSKQLSKTNKPFQVVKLTNHYQYTFTSNSAKPKEKVNQAKKMQQISQGALGHQPNTTTSNNALASSVTGATQAAATTFSASGSQHMTHQMLTAQSGQEPYEKCAIQFQLPNAIIWQIKFILSEVKSKKSVQWASQEFSALAEGFGRDFDKYLLKELMDQIEIRDTSKAARERAESVKITLLNQELARASLKPEFLTYFSEIMMAAIGQESTKNKPAEFLQEMTRRLKLNSQTQILVTLSMLESTEDEQVFEDVLKLFRQKLNEFHANGKPEQLPEYAVHRILYLFDTMPALAQDIQLREPKQFLVATIANRYSQFTPLRASLNQDISQINCHAELTSFNILKDGNGLEDLEFVHKMLEPWEVLIDIGHNSSYMYDFLLKTLQEFKGIDEKVLAQTILQLAINHQGKDDHVTKIVYNTFESNKDGNSTSIKKEPEDKKTQMSWSIDNLARAFRELYSTLNWNKVFECFGEIEDCDIPCKVLENGLDTKQFTTLILLFNKSKPQNFSFPLQNLLTQSWQSPSLQLTFIQNCIAQFTTKKEKSIQFSKLKNKAPAIADLQEIKERGEPAEMTEVWQSVELVERLIILSEAQGLFSRVRKVLEHPLNALPEYLLITLSLAKPSVGNIMIDELLSLLLPLFLGNHVNSSVVLQKLFETNKSLFIRGICELCKHDQRLMNLSRVLDITQEVKDSLLAIVYSEDYSFAVNLGILAGKRDFLHYDVWIQSRIKDVGTPFVNALVKYIWDHIINPVSDFVRRHQTMAEANPESFEAQKNAILDRSHLSKDKLILTIEHLRNPALGQNEKIHRDTESKIQELVAKNQELFPQHYAPGQNSEEIDAAANEHFQRVFSAKDNEVDARIAELIETMQNFKESTEVKDQEIYACMLHGLFDEYRFLHRYPQQYLTKIAKLFGAIIKNNLLDRVLQDIALKFVIEAFRRDGRRQKFGIIVIKSFFDMLPQFPKFLEDIYQIRQSIQTSEPQMMADIERLYQEMLQANAGVAVAPRPEVSSDMTRPDSSDDHHSYATQLADQIEAEEGKQSVDGNGAGNLAVISGRVSQSAERAPQRTDKAPGNLWDPKLASGGQPLRDSSKKGAANQRGNPQPQANQGGASARGNPKNQRQNQQNQAIPGPANQLGQVQNMNAQSLKSMTPPMANQAKEFVPTNRQQPPHSQPGQLAPGSAQQQNMSQAKVFVPTGQKQLPQGGMPNSAQMQPSSLVDHVNNMGMQRPGMAVNSAQFGMSNNGQMNPQMQSLGGSSLAAGGGTGLDVRSAEFVKPASSANVNVAPGMPFDAPKQPDRCDINSKEFLPSRSSQEAMFSWTAKSAQPRDMTPTADQLAELVSYQAVIEKKIKTALEKGGKVSLAELLDDDTIKVDNEWVEDKIRVICNHTVRGNFKEKIEELKQFVIKRAPKIGDDGQEIVDEKSARADEHLKWFIHCILTKRLGAQGAALLPIFVAMIRELSADQTILKGERVHSVVGQTICQATLIFKKCMVIEEDEFLKVTNIAAGGGGVIKGYLSSLGSFVGALTIAKNEPIRSSDLDLKQILLEGYQAKNRRLAVAFVCGILKESLQSRVFSPRNPWIYSLLSVLREVQDYSQPLPGRPGTQEQLHTTHEIDALFAALKPQSPLVLAELKPHGLLHSLENPSSLGDPVIRKELEFILNKPRVILPSQAAPAAKSLEEPQRMVQVIPPLSLQPTQAQYSESEMLRQQISQISQRVAVSPELTQILAAFPNFPERVVRRLVGDAVDNSIVEILPPVVDRSVTIALITTRELVLKDFAYDGDYDRVLKAADLIVQNLAGSLALVTCREPLRMSLTTNLKKIFDQHFRCELGLEVVATNGSRSTSTDQADPTAAQTPNQSNTQASSASLQSTATDQADQKPGEGPQVDASGFATNVTEEQINDIAVLASKDNLELGCKLIKKEVIEKALKKVREDPAIMSAVEKRKASEERGIRLFRDARIEAQFQELPPQLQPNQNGLTPAQFQVYEDFQKLGQPQREQEGPAAATPGMSLGQMEGGSGMASAPSSLTGSLFVPQSTTPQSLTQILKLIDQYGLTEAHKGHLLHKLNQMNTSMPTEDEREKLWTYVQRNLETACKNYDSRHPQGVEPIIQVLSLIVTSYTVENFSKKLLTNVFLQLDVKIFNQVELNILLMSKGIISISEWDSQLAIFFKESAAELLESELQFFAKFLETSIVEKKILTKEEVPQLISVIERMSHDPRMGQFCQYILDSLNVRGAPSSSLITNADEANLKEFFIKWVVMSYVDDKENQEKQINTLFKDLGGMGIDTEPSLRASFQRVMVKTSIEKALEYGDGSGEQRPPDRLDFRYIDSFVKLAVVLLKMFDFNKHEFMTKVLDYIGDVLDEDHRTKKAQFNQRPYYRMLMNILTAVNHSDCFNSKTQLLILFSMADLFKRLSPSAYPAFCFSWLELISHKQFLPHFLRAQPSAAGGQQMGAGGMLGQQQFLGLPGLQGGGGMGALTPDSTFYQKRCTVKELMVGVFTFLKNNMIPGQPVPPAIQAFYHATIRVVSVIKQDYPDFLSDFHFNFVNSLPEHCIQLRNLILSAYPGSIQQPDPFRKDLKIDLLSDIKQNPRVLSNYDNYLSLKNLREDLENYQRTRNPALISEICRKMEQSEEIANGRRRINSNVIGAVVLFMAPQAGQQKSGLEKHREPGDTFKQIVQHLNEETRLCFLNAIVNELRYPNNHTFHFSWTILSIYAEPSHQFVTQQITQIFLERLQTSGPHPWGLMISFRELIQNPKYEFTEKQYIKEHPQAVARLFQDKLRNFLDFVPAGQRSHLLNLDYANQK